MRIEKNVRVVKDFFAAIGSGDKQRILALVAEDIVWIIPGEDWPLAGTHRGHSGLENVLRKASAETRNDVPKAARVHIAGRPGAGHRRRYGKNQSHKCTV